MNAFETNGLLDPNAYHSEEIIGSVHLGDSRLVRIERVRFLTDRGLPFMDLSYCHGRLRDGSKVRVDLGRHQFGRRTYLRELVSCAKAAGRYGKSLGLLDTISICY